MKSFTTILFTIIISVAAVGQEFTDPGMFNNFIVNEQNKVTAKNLEYISFSVHSEDYAAITQKRNEVIAQIKSSYSAIEGISLENGDKMRQEALNVMSLYLETFQIDFPAAEALKKESESSYQAMEAYFAAQDKAEKKLSQATDRLNKAQEQLAKDFKMEIILEEGDTKTNNILKQINDVNDYTRKIYLINFKVSKENAAFWDAVDTRNTKGLDAKRNRVLEVASEAHGLLNTIPDFNGNIGYRESAKELIGFYKEMADDGYKAIVNVVKKEQADLTQADVEAYNAAITKYNTSVQGLTNKFNSANQRIMQENVPNMSGGGTIRRM